MSCTACSNRLSEPTDRGPTGHSRARDIVDPMASVHSVQNTARYMDGVSGRFRGICD
jgi:hypothetical protein